MMDASGLVHVDGDEFLVAEDESDCLRFFRLCLAGFRFEDTGRVLHLSDVESDLESLAHDRNSNTLYAIGSHLRRRHEKLLRCQLQGGDLAAPVQSLPFKPSVFIDGSVNIEALSIYRESLLIGLRSPKIDGKAAAIVFNPGSDTYVLALFDLRKRVFRDCARIDDRNYLILAGPRRGRDYARRPPLLFWWNGDLTSPRLLECRVDISGYRAEGLCVRTDPSGRIEILVGADESKNPDAEAFRACYASADSIEELWSRDVHARELTVDCRGPGGKG